MNNSAYGIRRKADGENTLFKGNWLVNYHPKEQKFPDFLVSLGHIQEYFDKNGIEFESINVNIKKNGKKSHFFKEDWTIYLNLNEIGCDFEEIFEKPEEIAQFKALERPIKTISLLFPRLESDPRWRSMGMPAGQILLSSSLKARGFEPRPLLWTLSGENRPTEALSADLAGFTLFEDLLPVLGPILGEFRGSYGGILAAGGPFPTLAPLAAAYHLPQANLFVRGEAELVLPGILEALNSGDAEAFFRNKGIFWQQPGLIAMAGFDKVNRPDNLGDIPIDLDFLKPAHIEHGLEMNFSRGCSRGCVFCCHAQGKKLRKLPLEKARELLEEYRNIVIGMTGGAESPWQESHPYPIPLLSRRDERGISSRWTDGNASPPTPSPKGEGGLKKAASRGNFPPSPPGEGGWGMGPDRSELMDSAVNINDDDILQDPGYARAVFGLIKEQGLRIFGIQTSTTSLVKGDGDPDQVVLDLVSDKELYVGGAPLLWLGTDAFLAERARRLGKKLPPPEKFKELLGELEKRRIRHYHYWISSDGESTWEKFVEELALLFSFFRDFPRFGLLAHAPFIVPYPSSRLFGQLLPDDLRLKIKINLNAPDARFGYRVVDRLETRWPQLNALLRNEKAGGEKGLFDFLKEKNFMAAAQLAYHFLKQEQLQSSQNDLALEKALKKLKDLIAKFLEIRDT
ncbi:MAG: hypothetical protein JXO51_07450 [Candidatus Aminicenantes bacterium]|nr:hypothetical protein [Candidatus Aminicenantes bacterium]